MTLRPFAGGWSAARLPPELLPELPPELLAELLPELLPELPDVGGWSVVTGDAIGAGARDGVTGRPGGRGRERRPGQAGHGRRCRRAQSAAPIASGDDHHRHDDRREPRAGGTDGG
jgi:hypothetical protein